MERRLVVNLGGPHRVSGAVLHWTSPRVPSYVVETSQDGVTWTRAATSPAQPGRSQEFHFDADATYVSVLAGDWRRGQAGVADLQVTGAPAP